MLQSAWGGFWLLAKCPASLQGLSEMQQKWQTRCATAYADRRSHKRASTALDSLSDFEWNSPSMGLSERLASQQGKGMFQDDFSLDAEVEWTMMSDHLAPSLEDAKFWSQRSSG